MQLLIVLILLLVGLALVGVIASSAATWNQAQAVVETARAAQISAAGQSAASIATAMLVAVLILVILIAAAVIIYLALQLRRARSVPPALANPPRQWAPGPNANYQQQLPARAQMDPVSALLLANLLAQQQHYPPPARLPQNSYQQPGPDDTWSWR